MLVQPMLHQAILKIVALFQRRAMKTVRSTKKIFFNLRLRSDTRLGRDEILREAESALKVFTSIEQEHNYLESADPLVHQGWALKKIAEKQFSNKYAYETELRILIQVPDANFSPAGFSLFSNIAESFAFLGIPVRILRWNEQIEAVLHDFYPTLLLASDHPAYLKRIQWSSLSAYRAQNPIRLGLTASIDAYGNTPLEDRLIWAQRNDIDFYFSFRDPDYVSSRPDYQPFFTAGFPMLFLPFGANINHYYPVPKFKRDLDYVLIATQKREHIDYLMTISRRFRGFIDGPGWTHVNNFSFSRARDRFIYARAKIGLNVHQPDQLAYACELNERTYQLAACGVPQLTDHARLLDKLFADKGFFVADNPREYSLLFKKMILNYQWATDGALLAQREVFEHHTTLHRAEHFILQFRQQFN